MRKVIIILISVLILSCSNSIQDIPKERFRLEEGIYIRGHRPPVEYRNKYK